MKLSLSKDTTVIRKKKVTYVVSAQDKQDQVKNISSDFSLELSEAKIEISRLKQELVNQKVKLQTEISNNFKVIRRDEIRKASDIFEEEKRNLIRKLLQEHTQRVHEINREHEQALNKAVLRTLEIPQNQSRIRHYNESRDYSDDILMELDNQYERDNGLLEPEPYDPELE
ncbi:Glutamine synthetase catalytic region-Glutamine synthetase, type III [Moritella viscosa]|uniref:hypothetical protein n=1 Tax=Moritella viscosa TaxID=80854 RepID=UPI0005091DEB|nr:hypothetical protein [Moritella viscosa]CED60673.1 putative uncharacterized protein [Moritella viscosa]SHO12368.1 Glutamine synthetase catalytic region-Glutamine synthetase, type III [Moritella viscosa]SHO23049.1 Glutamine synthetase catalytic region-Glutamine synthetase, type III [Moritella viscosa]